MGSVKSEPRLGGPQCGGAYRNEFPSQSTSCRILGNSHLINALEFEGRNLSAIDRLFSLFESVTEKVKESSSPELEFLLAINFFFAMFIRQRENPEIDTWAERGLALVGKPPYLPLKTTFLAFLTNYWLNKGELEKATRSFASIQNLIDSEEAPILLKVRGKNLEIIYCALQGQREQCFKAIEESLRLSQLTGAHSGELSILHDTIWLSYHFNEIEFANRSTTITAFRWSIHTPTVGFKELLLSWHGPNYRAPTRRSPPARPSHELRGAHPVRAAGKVIDGAAAVDWRV